jgi:hypothetical protein
MTMVFPRVSGIVGIATDGKSVFWTQGLGTPTAALFRHALTDGPASVTLLAFPSGDTFGAVAVDDTNVYTVGSSGAVYAIDPEGCAGRRRDRGSPRDERPALDSAGPGERRGLLRRRRPRPARSHAGGPSCTGPSGARPVTTAPAAAFAVDRCWLPYGTGASVVYAPFAQPTADDGTLNLDGLVRVLTAQGGFLAFSTPTTLTLAPEMACPE